ncbi:GxxExxY protein [soil metagenome]
MPFDDEDLPYAEPDRELDRLAHEVIGAAIEVHKRLGAGLDESLYRAAMCIELRGRNIPFVCEATFDVIYRDVVIGQRRIDLFVGDRLVVELKAVERLAPVHKAQVRTYLKIAKCKLGLLINFNEVLVKEGIVRIINSSEF